MSDTLERLREREPVRPHPNSVTRFEPFYELSESEFRALLKIAEAAQALLDTIYAGLPITNYCDELEENLASLDAVGGAER